MKKLSKYYRIDASEDIAESTKAFLDEHYLLDLKNLTAVNPKLLVVFSGGNAVGKSTIAHKIAVELNGLVIENDGIKRQLLTLNPDYDKDTLNKITWQYTINLYKRLYGVTSNGLVIRDGIIDWYFDRILPVFIKNGYELFIIGFDLSRQKIIEQIQKRGDTATTSEARLQLLLNDHELHQQRFRGLYKPDVILTDDNFFDHELVINKLKAKLATMTDSN